MSYKLFAIYFATSHFRQKKTTPCSLRMRKTPLTKGLKRVLLSQNKRTIAQVFIGSVLPSNEHFSSNVIQSNKTAPVAKPSKLLAVMILNNAL